MLGFGDYRPELVFGNERKINERHGGGTAVGPVVGLAGIGMNAMRNKLLTGREDLDLGGFFIARKEEFCCLDLGKRVVGSIHQQRFRGLPDSDERRRSTCLLKQTYDLVDEILSPHINVGSDDAAGDNSGIQRSRVGGPDRRRRRIACRVLAPSPSGLFSRRRQPLAFVIEELICSPNFDWPIAVLPEAAACRDDVFDAELGADGVASVPRSRSTASKAAVWNRSRCSFQRARRPACIGFYRPGPGAADRRR